MWMPSVPSKMRWIVAVAFAATCVLYGLMNLIAGNPINDIREWTLTGRAELEAIHQATGGWDPAKIRDFVNLARTNLELDAFEAKLASEHPEHLEVLRFPIVAFGGPWAEVMDIGWDAARKERLNRSEASWTTNNNVTRGGCLTLVYYVDEARQITASDEPGVSPSGPGATATPPADAGAATAITTKGQPYELDPYMSRYVLELQVRAGPTSGLGGGVFFRDHVDHRRYVQGKVVAQWEHYDKVERWQPIARLDSSPLVPLQPAGVALSERELAKTFFTRMKERYAELRTVKLELPDTEIRDQIITYVEAMLLRFLGREASTTAGYPDVVMRTFEPLEENIVWRRRLNGTSYLGVIQFATVVALLFMLICAWSFAQERESERSHALKVAMDYALWVMPSLGFLGTIVGIGTALMGAGDIVIGTDVQKTQVIRGMTDGLAVAFDTTFVGLGCSIIAALVEALLSARGAREQTQV